MATNKIRVAQAHSDHWGPPKIHAAEYGVWDRIFGNRWKPLCRPYIFMAYPTTVKKSELTSTVTCKHCLKQLAKRGIK